MVEELTAGASGAENVANLPKYLNVSQKLSPPSCLNNEDAGNEWALFRDNDGRVLAQRIEVVENEEHYLQYSEEFTNTNIEKSTESKNPEYILVVATDFAEDGVELMAKSTKHFADTLETFEVENCENITNDNILCDKPKTYVPVQSFDDCKPEYFPCIRTQWYIQKPLNSGQLVDDITIVNTTILANDIRSFLKNNSISLENFAKLYMKRTQGTVSDLLNHPKNWQELSRKGRETYIKFMEFLSDINLQSNIKEMRSKNSFPNENRLPSSLMVQLEQGIQPSDEEVSDVAALFQLEYSTLMRYCQLQLSVLRASVEFIQLEEHIISECGKIICGKPGCGTVLHDKAALNMHLKKTCEHKYFCSICEDYFKTKTSYDSHFTECHQSFMECTQSTSPKSFEDIEKDSLLVGNDVDLENQKFICCVCWCGFKSRQKLTKHLSAKHKVCQKDLRPGVTCFVCFKLLKNLHALDVHMRTHNNARPFCCDICHAAFQTKANLQRHIKTHTGEKPFACTHCSSRFIEKKALVIHLRTHTGEKPFQCQICNKCFVHKTPLKLHMLIHEGKKPHTCDKCGKQFRQKINLKVHMKRHRGDKKHKCPTCNLSFLTKTDWNRHNMIHTGEKPFQCELCSKTFTRNCYLRDHLERLKNVTAPQCETCEKRFCNDATLKRHRKSHALMPPPDLLLDRKVNPKEAMGLDTFQYSESSPNPNANANVLLLSTKSTVGNDRQYFVTPIQSFEGGSDDINRLSLQSVMLTQNDGYSIPIAGIDGQPLFLQCVDIAGNSAPLFGSNGELLSSLKDIAIPITFSTAEDTNVENVLEASDPNMHSTASKSLDDSTILSGEDMNDRVPPTSGIVLSEDQSSLIVAQTQQIHGNSVLIMPNGDKNNTMERNHIPVPVRVNDVILTETGGPEISVQSCVDPSKNQTFVVVEP